MMLAVEIDFYASLIQLYWEEQKVIFTILL